MKLKHGKNINYNLFFNIFKKIINFEYSDISELKDLFKTIAPDYKPN
tara:strand:+ start:102 stop:242 length:141 start_codon:yes stop_codon:yes gene_type:complete